MEPQEYWNNFATDKTFTTAFDWELFAPRVKKDSFILDVGCGYGRIMALLWENGYHNLTGVDPTKALIQRGKRLYPHLHLQLQKPNDLLGKIKTNSIDVILLYAVLTCVPDNDQQSALIKESRRVLKPGGLIFCSDFLLNQDQRNLQRYQQHAEKYGTYGVFELAKEVAFRHHSDEYIKTLFADFKLEHWEKKTHQTMNGNLSNGFHLVARKPKMAF